MKQVRALITSKGQLTLPREIREQLGVTKGQEVAFTIQDDGTITVQPVRTEHNPFLAWIGAYPAGRTAEQITRETRHAGLTERDLAALRSGDGPTLRTLEDL